MLLAERMRNKEKLIGMYVEMTDIASAKIAGLADYDYVWVDTEHACDYGYKDSMAYAKASVKGIARFIQVEHRETIENLDEIMKNEYIDGYVFGPCDLSGSYEVLGDVYGEKITAGADFDFIRDSAVRNCENIKRIHKGQ